MEKAKTVSRFSWVGWLGRPQTTKASRTAPAASPKHATDLSKIKSAKVRAAPKTGKSPMQSLAQLRYVDLSRAFKQAPWRVQVQVIASLAAGTIVLVALGGLYLTEASRAATAGRDVQTLQVAKADLQFAIDRQTTLIAEAKSVSRLQKRAEELGYAPAQTEQIDFVLVDGYYGPRLPGPAETVPAPVVVQTHEYDQTLGAWLASQLSFVLGSGG
jgi:hypothetical protein